ncbi:MAG: pyridoxal-phosphate dependent enzyme [Bacteroidota bacterium]
MLEKLEFLEKRIGNTPLIKLNSMENLYVKLEAYQLGQSIKVRPALAILKEAIKSGHLKHNSEVIESTSGNFGIALAMCCNLLSIKFIAVIDKNTPEEKKKMLKLLKADVVLIDQKDSQGAYLLNRLEYVKNYLATHPNCFNPNQYFNHNNPGSYYTSLAPEICCGMDKLEMPVCKVRCRDWDGAFERFASKQRNEGTRQVVDGQIALRAIDGRLDVHPRHQALDIRVIHDVGTEGIDVDARPTVLLKVFKQTDRETDDTEVELEVYLVIARRLRWTQYQRAFSPLAGSRAVAQIHTGMSATARHALKEQVCVAWLGISTSGIVPERHQCDTRAGHRHRSDKRCVR